MNQVTWASIYDHADVSHISESSGVGMARKCVHLIKTGGLAERGNPGQQQGCELGNNKASDGLGSHFSLAISL